MDIPKMQQLKRGSLEMILLSLISNHNCSYGYAILNALDEMGEDLFRNSKPGTVYPVLYRLEADNLIQVVEDANTASQKKRYEITSKGTEELKKMIDVWQHYVDVVNKFIKE